MSAQPSQFAPTARRPIPAGRAEPVSVVMAARDEEPYLADAVGSIMSQDYDGELELVIAVGPSTDRTAEVASELAAADPRIIVVHNPTGRIAAAINLAFRASRHPVVVRVDGHSMLPSAYIRTALQTLRDTGAVNVGGVMAAEGITPFQQAVAWAMTSPYGVGVAKNHTGGETGPADTAYLGVFRRAAVEQVGGYNEKIDIAEDWELNHRIRQAGGLIWFQPALRVTYRPRASVRALAVQYFRYGRWRRVVSRQHAGTINLRYLAPPLTVAVVGAGTLAGLAGAGALAAGAAGSWPALLTIGFAAPVSYLGAVALLSLGATRQLAPAAAARLPLALVTMHMSWGTGFLTSPRRLVPRGAPGPGVAGQPGQLCPGGSGSPVASRACARAMSCA